jgi:hypothetical protein
VKPVGEFVHEPVVAVSVEPCDVAPLIPGATELAGTPGIVTALAVAETDPIELVAVTTAAMLLPASVVRTVYVELVAPAMFVPFFVH